MVIIKKGKYYIQKKDLSKNIKQNKEENDKKKYKTRLFSSPSFVKPLLMLNDNAVTIKQIQKKIKQYSEKDSQYNLNKPIKLMVDEFKIINRTKFKKNHFEYNFEINYENLLDLFFKTIFEKTKEDKSENIKLYKNKNTYNILLIFLKEYLNSILNLLNNNFKKDIENNYSNNQLIELTLYINNVERNEIFPYIENNLTNKLEKNKKKLYQEKNYMKKINEYSNFTNPEINLKNLQSGFFSFLISNNGLIKLNTINDKINSNCSIEEIIEMLKQVTRFFNNYYVESITSKLFRNIAIYYTLVDEFKNNNKYLNSD